MDAGLITSLTMRRVRDICCLIRNCPIKKTIVVFMLTLSACSFNTKAMTNPIYSYSIENGEINLVTVGIPYGTEILDIPSEIGNMTVTSIDDNFTMYQLTDDGATHRIRNYRQDTNLVTGTSLSQINIPTSIKLMSGPMLKEFTKYGPYYYPFAISLPEGTVLSNEENRTFYNSSESYMYRIRSPKIEVPLVSLIEVGTPINVFVGNDKNEIAGAMLFNGVTYIPYDEFYKSLDRVNWSRLLEQTRHEKELMVFDCDIANSTTFLDGNGEYTSEENASYYNWLKRILLNANTGEMMVFEYYNSESEHFLNNGIPGGIVTTKIMPIFPNYVPLRAVCEEIGYIVDWDCVSGSAYVTE